MSVFILAWGIVGVVLGALGSEVLRNARPGLVQKVEDAAKRFVDSMSSSKKPDAPKAKRNEDSEDDAFG
jgi:hypothetical protein